MYKIMFVDDEFWILNGLKQRFNWYELGFEVVAAETDVYRALDSFKAYRPQVVFVDINMPGMDGIQLSEELQKLSPEVHIVILSGYSSFDYAQKAIRLGVREYMLKPVDNNELLRIVTKLREELDKEHNATQEATEQAAAEFPAVYNCRRDVSVIQDYIRLNFRQNITLAELSDRFHLDPSYISKIFKQETGENFSAFLTNCRMEYACKLLKTTDTPAIQIGGLCGYSEYPYFKKVFRKAYGKTPREYREEPTKQLD
ncbi:MAG: response regulator [Angelakisella sp.]